MARKLSAHGLSATYTYASWEAMRQRCNDPSAANYGLYGGRGIRICSRWDNYLNFLADMGERPPGQSIDRIDVNGNYEPGNCRWATPIEQRSNQRERVRTHCKRGHPYTEENRIDKPKSRGTACRECKRIYDRWRHHMKKGVDLGTWQ